MLSVRTDVRKKEKAAKAAQLNRFPPGRLTVVTSMLLRKFDSVETRETLLRTQKQKVLNFR